MRQEGRRGERPFVSSSSWLESHAYAATDEVLMRRVQADDAHAFGELYDRHVARALSIGVRSTRAEDVVQEGFLSVWRSRASSRAGAGSFQAWAMTIIRHRAVAAIRSESAGARPQLTDVTARLRDAQAEVITLAVFGELTRAEIAAQLALPEGTIKGAMRLGLDRLRS